MCEVSAKNIGNCKVVGDTEAYVQGGTEIQVVYPTDLYLLTISLQFEQSIYKYLHQNLQCRQNYKDLV